MGVNWYMNERAVERFSWIAYVSSSVVFLLPVCLVLLSQEELATAFGGCSFWEVSIYEKVAWSMEICFGAISLIVAILYLSARCAVTKGIVSENLKKYAIGTHMVALSAWLTYVLFFGLAPASASVPVKLIVTIFPVHIALVCLLTYSEVNNTVAADLVLKLVKEHTSALAIFAVGLAIYFSFLSCSLSEWDSFNFAQALDRFDLGAHQPHPPGYSLYVLFGRLVSLISGDKLFALTSVSAVSGALCLVSVYVIVRKMYDSQTAVVTCLALMSTRMYWLSSEKAVTHMFGTFLMTVAICLLYLGFKGKKNYFFMSWPMVGIALGARPSYFPFLGLWLYGTIRDKDLRKLPMYLTLFACSIVSWLAPTILLTGWGRFWELIRRQYVYVSVNEFVGAKYGMQPVERFLSILGGLISSGFGAPIQLMYRQSRPLGIGDTPSILILCLHVTLIIFVTATTLWRKWGSNKTFFVIWTVPYFIVVYLISAPHYPRYMLPIIPPIVIAVVSTSWSKAQSIKASGGKSTLKKVLFGLVVALILLNFVHSARLAATIHTTKVPMGQLTQHIRNRYTKSTVVIVFHEYEAFEYRLPEYRYLSAQYDNGQAIEILRNLSKKNQTVLITDTAIRYVLGPTIERLGLETIQVARFEMDPQVETEQYTIVLYRLQARVVRQG